MASVRAGLSRLQREVRGKTTSNTALVEAWLAHSRSLEPICQRMGLETATEEQLLVEARKMALTGLSPKEYFNLPKVQKELIAMTSFGDNNDEPKPTLITSTITNLTEKEN